MGGRPEFDIARHVTELGEAGPVSMERFRALTDAVLSEPLERDRPLWHVYLVRQLEDGRLGLIFKMHHALVDGKSAVELALLLFDTSPDAEPEPRRSGPGKRPERRAPRARRVRQQRRGAVARGARHGADGGAPAKAVSPARSSALRWPSSRTCCAPRRPRT